MSSMSVLTRDEAQTRAQLLDVHRYHVDLDLTTGGDTFDSRTHIRFTVREGQDRTDTFVELKPDRLRSATLDGQPLDPESLDGNRLPLKNLTPGEHELRVDTAMRYSRTGEGMHRFTDPTDGETYLYTQLFMDDVQRVFAAFDQPDLKAVFELTVKAPEEWTVLANTVTEHLGDGRWQAAPTPLISTYLVAVAAGPWHSVRTEHRGLPFALHCRRSLAPYLDADADEILDVTRACFDRYHEKFDEPYPFDSYDQAFVPEFNAGAMENPGLVTFRDEFVYRSAVTDAERQTRAMVIAHEMAHMWFGDLVTLKWWDDIWLNESFAEYMGYQTLTEATRFTDTWTDFGVVRKGWGYDADQRPSTHPVAPEAVDDTASALLNFDGISYAKGASALRQLVAWLGEKDFLTGINCHFTRHKFANATLADFIDSLAAATDRDVHAWADAWLRTTGVDKLTPRITPADHGTCTLTVDRAGSRPHHITVGLYDRDLTDNGRLALRERLDLDIPHTHRPAHRQAPRPAPAQRRRPHLRQGPLRPRVVRHPALRPVRPARTPHPRGRLERPQGRRTRRRTAARRLPRHRPRPPPARDRPGPRPGRPRLRHHPDHRPLPHPRRPPRRPVHPQRPVPRPHPPHRGRRPPRPAPDRRTPLHRRRRSARHHRGLARRGHRARRTRTRPRAALARPGASRRPRRHRRGRHRRRARPRPQRHRPGRRRPLPRRPARRRGQGPRVGGHVQP
ncbi:aminopeptidase N [Streptomyces sp. SAI-170]